MSSDESDNNASESEQEEEEEKPVTTSKPAATRSTESKVNLNAAGLDDSERELLEFNKNERDKIENEIEELRKRSEKRKKQREEEEKRLAAERIAEDEKRKSNEEARKRQKIEEAERKQKERALKLAEFEKWKTPQKRNFVITRKENGEEEVEDTGEEEDDKGRKSKEQQEAEKKATLKQRIKPLDTSELDQARLAEKAKEIHSWLARLESEKYDLEKWLKSQQATLQDLAEKARQANKVGKGGLKRVGEDQIDKIQAKYTGAPAKVEMFSKYERQKDNRTYQEMYEIFIGPQYISPPERILPKRTIDWDEERMPVYSGSAPPAETAHVPEAVEAN